MADAKDNHTFCCSVCLDVYTDPVSTPCGHNFCKSCIESYWDSTDVSRCPLCKQIYYKRPELRVNVSFREVVDHFKKGNASTEVTHEGCEAQAGDVVCDVCTGLKLKAVQSCLVCMASYCETHLGPHKTAAALSRHKLIKPIMNLDDRMCKKHEKLLELFCRKEDEFVCQICAESDHSRHQVVTVDAESQHKMIQIKRKVREVGLMIQDRHKRIEEIDHCMKRTKDNAKKEMEASVRVYTILMRSIEKTHMELMEEIEARHEAELKRFKELIAQLREEIAELERKNAELEEPIRNEDTFTFLQDFGRTCTLPSTQNWPSIPIFEIDFLSYIRTSLMKAREFVNLQIRQQSATELKKVQQFAENITIDPNTAGPWLVLSEDGKELRQSPKKQKVPSGPSRFTENTFALATQGLNTGRHYWEVGVKEKSNWLLGVATSTVKRGELLTPSPEKGLWTVSHRDGRQYVVFAQKPFPVTLSPHPQTVGVFVDYEEGEVSFFNVEAKTHIFSYTNCDFSGKIYPLFDPCLTRERKEASPLKLMTVEITK